MFVIWYHWKENANENWYQQFRFDWEFSLTATKCAILPPPNYPGFSGIIFSNSPNYIKWKSRKRTANDRHPFRNGNKMSLPCLRKLGGDCICDYSFSCFHISLVIIWDIIKIELSIIAPDRWITYLWRHQRKGTLLRKIQCLPRSAVSTLLR